MYKRQYLDAYLNKPHLRLRATLDPEDGYSGAEYVVIAVPTDFNPRENAFDTAMVESVIRQVLRYAPEAVMVIKSTVPVGFTQSMQSKYPAGHITVSYTHLTLPTIYSVKISVVVVSLKKKKKQTTRDPVRIRGVEAS